MKIEVKRLNDDEISHLGIKSWSVWTKEPSEFDWYYDEREQCLFLEGSVTVRTADEDVEIGKGDFVTFPKGLKCVWIVKEAVRKHYRFG